MASKTLKGAELNYPVHEKELLAVIRAIHKWKVDLIGSPFFVYTDHKTLLNFHTQRDLSHRQARWMEELAIYDCKFVYVKGECNSVADSLSRFPFTRASSSSLADLAAIHPSLSPVTTLSSLLIIPQSSPISCVAALTSVPAIPLAKTSYLLLIDTEWVAKLQDAYKSDPWCCKLLSASQGMPDLVIKDGLWFVNDRLFVPANCGLCKHIFQLAHGTLGHFGFLSYPVFSPCSILTLPLFEASPHLQLVPDSTPHESLISSYYHSSCVILLFTFTFSVLSRHLRFVHHFDHLLFLFQSILFLCTSSSFYILCM